jgi:hypothetical protein
VSELSGSRNPNCTILGVEREFAPIERAEDTREEHLVVVPGEKHALDCLIFDREKELSCTLPHSPPPGHLESCSSSNCSASEQLREPDNLRTFVSSPHPDYKRAARVFGGLRAEQCSQKFTFAHESKPFYRRGPGKIGPAENLNSMP